LIPVLLRRRRRLFCFHNRKQQQLRYKVFLGLGLFASFLSHGTKQIVAGLRITGLSNLEDSSPCREKQGKNGLFQ